MWCMHLPTQCKGKAPFPRRRMNLKQKPKHMETKKTASRAKCKVDALKLNAAHQTIVEATQFDQEDNMSETFITDLDYKSSSHAWREWYKLKYILILLSLQLSPLTTPSFA